MKWLYRSTIEDAVFDYFNISSLADEKDQSSYAKSLALEVPLKLKVLSALNLFSYRDATIKAFIKECGDCYILPLCDLVSIRGFEVRAIEKKAFRLISDGQLSFYGFNYFRGFKYGDVGFVTEGVKDACALRQVYPYVIAALGVTVSKTSIEYLKGFSNHWVFVHDSDYWGRKSAKRVQSLGLSSVVVPLGKDLGTLFEGNLAILSYIESLVGAYIFSK